MNPKDRLADDEAGRFRTTHWSVVLLSAQSQTPGSRTALADLCRLYWYPLYAFVRRRGYSAEDAQDLTHGFFVSLLERKSLGQVAPQKGKFRSFLLASLKNYLSDAFDRKNSILNRREHCAGGSEEAVQTCEEKHGACALGQRNRSHARRNRWSDYFAPSSVWRLQDEDSPPL